MISSLAKGADRIVAQCVLEKDKKYARLEAVLPFSREEYAKDFTDADDLAEFNALIKLDAIAVQPVDAPGL